MKRSCVILSSIISVILGGLAVVGSTSALEYQTNPSSGDNPVTLKFEFGQTLTISTDGNISISSLTPGTKAISNSNYNVTVSTNNLTGYTLSATVGCSSGTNCYDNKNLSDGTNNFTMLANDGALTSGTWGVSLDSTATENSNFKTLAKYDETATILNQTTSNTGTAATGYTGTDATTVRIGAYAANSQVAGTYTNSINFIAVANVLPTPCSNTVTGTMQEFYPCSSIADGTSGTLTDARDNNTYNVTKINGQWWMIQNLRYLGDIGSTTGTMTISNSNSNVANKSITLYSLDSSSTGDFGAYSEHCDDTNGYNFACVYDSGSTSTGVWYNYYAASAGTISANSNFTTASNDICPANWHLPSGPSTTADTDLNKLIGNTTSGWQTATNVSTAFNAVAGGYYYTGSLSNIGYGDWWSANVVSTMTRFILGYNSNNGQFAGNVTLSRFAGLFVRCVLSD